MKLPLDYYRSSQTLQISQNLLGKVLVTHIGHHLTSGIIVETEAYLGVEDKASHAYAGLRSKRTETMYLPGGVCYVYLCYGMHYLLNVVTHEEGVPHAVLIRAIQPLEGEEIMLDRRKQTKLSKQLTSGPAKLTQALGITTHHDCMRLDSDVIWIEDRGIQIEKKRIVATPRIGIDYAKEYASKPWRYFIADNPWVSK